MDNQTYDKVLTDFLAQAYLESAKRQSQYTYSTKEVENSVNHSFKEFSSIFNKTLAREYLENIETLSPSISDKLNNYPSLFWTTPQGENTINQLVRKDIKKLHQNLFNILLHINVENKDALDNLKTILDQEYRDFLPSLLKLCNKNPNASYKILNDLASFIKEDIVNTNIPETDKAQKVLADVFVHNIQNEIRNDTNSPSVKSQLLYVVNTFFDKNDPQSSLKAGRKM